jgi:hypothetical protein
MIKTFNNNNQAAQTEEDPLSDMTFDHVASTALDQSFGHGIGLAFEIGKTLIDAASTTQQAQPVQSATQTAPATSTSFRDSSQNRALEQIEKIERKRQAEAEAYGLRRISQERSL